MTARTTREAFGQQLPPAAFDNEMPDRPMVVASLLAASVFAALWGADLLSDRFGDAHELVKHGCTIVDTLAGDSKTMLWHCSDGYRVSPVNVMDSL